MHILPNTVNSKKSSRNIAIAKTRKSFKVLTDSSILIQKYENERKIAYNDKPT